ncbi:MAG: hypothetical protein KDD67_03395 [Ignavibacteriae bacterium]|nr:hypothetical protein [Ignavibacteriota bacterium]MCB9217126.1 hypothetical protein [Ignavibacteria bacterium]
MKNKSEESANVLSEPSEVSAIIRVRCPECKKGIVYAHGSQMNRLCPSCGIKFEREPGYFSGAIWIGVLLATPVALFTMFCLLWFFRDLHPAIAGIVASLSFIPLIPLTIRISRSIWMYLDHQMNPETTYRNPPDNPDDIRVPVPPENPGMGASIPVVPAYPDKTAEANFASGQIKQEMMEV